MKIGFIGFGEVAYTLSQGLLEGGAEVFTCIKNRSSKTQNLARKSNVKLCYSDKELAESSDILISSVVPSMAVPVADVLGKHVRGIYVDINNVSPKKVRESLGLVKNQQVVDAAIIGSVKNLGSGVPIIASGDFAEDFMLLNDFGLNIRVVGSDIGHASAIKMLRSSYTKGVSALLWETISAAYKMGVHEEVFKIIAETEGSKFEESARSRLISSAFHSKRRHEEMNEVQEFLSESIQPRMAQCTENVFESLFENIGKMEKRPEDYQEVFELFFSNNAIK